MKSKIKFLCSTMCFFIFLIAFPRHTIANPYELVFITPESVINFYNTENLPIISEYEILNYIPEKDYIQNDIELLPWSIVSQIINPSTILEIYDIGTGLTYNVYSFSNGNHADVVTLTREDTDILFYTFGNRWNWNVRPVWVTIGDITVAASINGMPHGNSQSHLNNGLGGHICLHFYGSNTHNGNVSFARLHQQEVLTAFNYRKE
ncbi:MAG: hypothetical protein FWF57_02945 [Defluviitaleaceae bacterium]|nr:hypothetical protein [Defluviitaleaceae bacterium]